MSGKRFCVLLTFSLVLSSVLFAQGNLGGLTGNVVDSTGAVVPDVRVVLRNVATNIETESHSTASGYVFRAVPPGVYRVEAEKPGFKKFIRESVNIPTATTVNMEITLDVGQVTESVTVSAEVAALQTTSPEVGTIMARQVLLDLPIQVGGSAATTAASGRRQPETFIFLTPGVTGIPWSKTINGSPDFTQEILIDGISAQLPTTAGFLAQTPPPYEAIEEFKVQNTLYPAEFGRGLGVINYSMKSGTNQFHGGLFEFLRNDKLDSRPFFAAQRPIVRFNEYGGNLGGPLFIPKLYNGRDRTFWNFNYTGLRNGPPTPGNLVTVPAMPFRTGDFSSYVDSAGALIPIFDPDTTQANGARTPFPGNIIPADRHSAVGKKVLELLPPPDLPGYFNNYQNRQANPVTDDVWSVKVDHSVTSNLRVSYAMWIAQNDQIVGGVFGKDYPVFGRWFDGWTPGKGYRGNVDHVVRPNLIHHFGLGYTYSGASRRREPDNLNDLIGLKGVAADATGIATFNISSPYGSLTSVGNSDQQPADPSDKYSWHILDNWTWIKGRHQLKFGAEYRHLVSDIFDGTRGGGLSGVFSFSSALTTDLASPNSNRMGDGFASLLLGYVSSGSRLVPGPITTMRSPYWAWFVEDVVKITPKFTLTLGLRHELPSVVYATDSRQSYLDLRLPNPAAGNLPGALAFLNSGGRLTDRYLRAFSPRVGIAYTLNAKTVIRTGFGVFYSPTNATQIGRMNGFFQHGFDFIQEFPNLTASREPAFKLDDGIPTFTGSLPITNPSLMNNGRIDYMNPGAGKPGYASSWNFGIQRELPAGVLADVNYVGQKGVALPSGLENLNQVDVKYLSLGQTLLADVNSDAARAAGIVAPYPGFRGSVNQALRPYPQFVGINNLYQPIGWNTYNSLQVRVQKRYSNGLSGLIAYTISKTFLSDGGASTGFGDSASGSIPLDTKNYGLEKRLAGYDFPQNLILSWTYELPFGRGKRFLSGAHSAVDHVLGGWVLNGIHTYRSGSLISVGGGVNIPLFNGGSRITRLPNVPVRTDVSGSEFDPAIHQYLNINAFTNPAPYTFGYTHPVLGDVRTFRFLNEDISILKNFRLYESHTIQFRAEFFNLPNRVVFGGPSSSINAPASFGRIGGQANAPRSIQFALKYSF